jgi:hypothetical protein
LIGESRLYWFLWALATATTGLVAGCFLGHALLLGPFLDWLLESRGAIAFATTYPVFRAGPGRVGLALFYGLAGLQVLAAVAFAVVSYLGRRARWPGIVVGAAAIAWPLVHYASGFAAVEARVLRSATPVPPDAAASFVAWNSLVHLAHVSALLVALAALLARPLICRKA